MTRATSRRLTRLRNNAGPLIAVLGLGLLAVALMTWPGPARAQDRTPVELLEVWRVVICPADSVGCEPVSEPPSDRLFCEQARQWMQRIVKERLRCAPDIDALAKARGI